MPATTLSRAAWKSLVMPLAVLAPREDRGLIADVGEVGAGHAARLARHGLHVHVVGERLAARVDREDVAAALEVRRRHKDLAVEAAGPQQRRVELLEQVRGGDHD